MLHTVHPVHALVMLEMCVCVCARYNSIAIVYVCLCMCKCACFHNISAVQNYHKTFPEHPSQLGTCNVSVKNLSVYKRDSSQSDVPLQCHLVMQ